MFIEATHEPAEICKTLAPDRNEFSELRLLAKRERDAVQESQDKPWTRVKPAPTLDNLNV